jgi:hypothetical protein
MPYIESKWSKIRLPQQSVYTAVYLIHVNVIYPFREKGTENDRWTK